MATTEVRLEGELVGTTAANISLYVTDKRGGPRHYRAIPAHGWFEEAADHIAELFPGSRNIVITTQENNRTQGHG